MHTELSLDCTGAQAQAEGGGETEGKGEGDGNGKGEGKGEVEVEGEGETEAEAATVPLTLSQALLGAVTGSRRGLDTNRVGALMRYLGYAQSSPSPCPGLCPAHCQYTTLPPPLPSPSPSPVPSSLRLYVPVADRPIHHTELLSSYAPTGPAAAAAAAAADGPSHRLSITGTWNARTGSVLRSFTHCL